MGPVASETIALAVHGAWGAAVHSATGRLYYENFETGETTWDAPPGFELS